MKIKTKKISYNESLKIPCENRYKPKKPNFIFRSLVRLLAIKDLLQTKFSYKSINMDKIAKNEPCLILMNHSSFIDLKIASKIFYPKPFNIVCTKDAIVGKKWLMRQLGCVTTTKFVNDIQLVKDINYCLNVLKTSVLIYPEAGYSFDGTSTILPDSVGKLIKSLNASVVTVITSGAFLRDPLYNNLQLRKVKTSAIVECVLDKNEISSYSANDINKIIRDKFSFDAFREQQQNNIIISEGFRTDYLERVLYKCPNCNSENTLKGLKTTLTCTHCNKQYTLTENGYLLALSGETEFNHIPNWVNWQRDCVKKELLDNLSNYKTVLDVDIAILKDSKSLYFVGDGVVTHTKDGFSLTNKDNTLNYTQPPLTSYSLNADYYWYEIGDVFSIGTTKIQYYCFPKNKNYSVTKLRFIVEELYKYYKNLLTK